MAKMIFVNLPVADLARATAFYEAIGAVKSEQDPFDPTPAREMRESLEAIRHLEAAEGERRGGAAPGGEPVRRGYLSLHDASVRHAHIG